jgi:hypothetical protein
LREIGHFLDLKVERLPDPIEYVFVENGLGRNELGMNRE